MNDYDFEIKNKILNKIESKENITRIKIKDYFNINKNLIKSNYDNFLKYISLEQICTTDRKKKLLWNKMAMYSLDKNSIDYEAAICGMSDFFEEEEKNNISEVNNKLSNKDNDWILDIDLKSLKKNNNNLQKVKNINNDIDEFINDIKDKKELLYGIRFINELYFNNLKETDIEKDFENNNNRNLIKINKNIIINEIKEKYKFINIPNDILQKYFNFISKENKNKNEIIVENSFIKYIDKNIKNIIIDYKNTIKNNIHINSNNFNNINWDDNNIISKKIDYLSLLDDNIVNCIKIIIDFNNNKNLLELTKEFIENYIIELKNTIYQEIKSKENKYEQKLIALNKNIFGDNKYIEEENKKLKKQIENLIKENLSLSNELEEITLKKENDIIKKENIYKNKEEYISPNKVNINNFQKNKNKIIIPTLNLKEQINYNKENKIIINEPKIDYYNYNLKNNASSGKSKMNIIKSPNKLLQTGTNSFNDICNDELTNSHVEFSMNLNNITDQFLLDTTRLITEGEEINNNDEKMVNNKNNEKENKYNSTKYINKKKESKIGNYLYSDASSKSSNSKDEEKEENLENYDNYENYNIVNLGQYKIHKYKYNNHLTDRNIRYTDFQNNNYFNLSDNNSFNNNYNKSQIFYSPNINNNQWKKKGKFSNEDIFYGYMNKAIKDFYDFKYLSHKHKIQKLFSQYKEKLIYDQFLSDEINAYFLNSKKKKCILLITYQSFYFLKSSESLNCFLRLNNKFLESITVSSKNFNLLLLSFNEGTDIIIETFQRIEILRFLQNIIDKKKFSKELKISSSNNFFLHKKNRTLEKVSTIKNKLFLITPNFENAQKFGVLLKYKETIFSASFQEKLIVLCSIGLMYFDENSNSPKDIIPIVGTTIKFIVVQVNKKIYCLKLKTIDEGVYIFGSLQKREIFDWLKELAHYKKVYHMKMKQINPNFVLEDSKYNSNMKTIKKINSDDNF